jgi:UDP:flavonoid glycosyltransferase YjiC (YdhE family)
MPSYTPPPDLDAFLKAGPPPVYIGFGSIVVDDPESLIKTVLDAVKKAGVRAIVSKGWSNLESTASDEKIYFIGDCPHGKFRSFAQLTLLVADFSRKNGFFNR